MVKKRAPKGKAMRSVTKSLRGRSPPDGTSSTAAQKQKQTQIVNVHVGSAKRARRRAKRQPKKDVGKAQSAPLYAFNPPPIINFPPGFAPQNQPNAWATPPPPIPQRQRAAFMEGEVAELLNQPKTDPVRLTFEGSIAERLKPRKEAAPLEAPAVRDEAAVPSLFGPSPEIGFTEPETVVEPEFSAEEIARNEAASAKEAFAAERAAEEEALAEEAAQRRILADGVKTMASIAAAERGAAAAAEAELPFAAEPVLPTTAEELARNALGAPAEPSKKKSKKPKAEGPIVPFNNRDPRYAYNKEGRQYFTPSGAPVRKKLKEVEPPGVLVGAAQPLGSESRYAESSSSSASFPPLIVAREPLPPLVTVRSSESVNREPYTFLGSSSLPPEKPSGLERQRREGFSGKSGAGSVLSGAEETLLSGSSAVSANWPYGTY